MSIVKYKNGRFNVGQAMQDGWGIEWAGESALIGLELIDRTKPKNTCTISKVDWFVGTLRVFYDGGGWQCFDHCIEQFTLRPNQVRGQDIWNCKL